MGSYQSKRIFFAIHDYQSTSREDISFVKGDRLVILDDSDDDWWRVRNLRTRSKGLIPKYFVVPEGSLECKDYFHGKVGRKEADKLLLNSSYGRGTFLIRNSEKSKSGYSLSIKMKYEDNSFGIKHYRINVTNNNFSIASHDNFPTLDSLVCYYKESHHGLCCRLREACPKQIPDLYDIKPMFKKDWKIPRDEIRLEKRLGQGNFGEVWYGKWNEQTEIAVKTMKPGTMSKESFLQEAETMKKLRHQKLVALYGVCVKGDELWIITQYIKHGSLLDFLRADAMNRPTFEDLIYIAAQVASGMAYLEKKKLIHRDIAARNILIGDNNVAKIADFGLARAIIQEEYTLSTESKFPIKWTAPEAVTHQKFTIKSDVWSFGILLYEIFTYGGTPYPGMAPQAIIDNVLNGYRMPKPKYFVIPDVVYEVMCLCWQLDPLQRPTFDYLEDFFEYYGSNTEGYYN